MPRLSRGFFLVLGCVGFLAPSFRASRHAAQTSSAVTTRQASEAASPASLTGPPALQAAPQKKITEYTLPPDLYRKARNRSRIRFASTLFGFLYGLFVLWFILHRKLSAKFRGWAENASRKRFVQAFVFTPLFALTFGILQLPLDLFDESISKLYKISVQPWPSWLGDWAKA